MHRIPYGRHHVTQEDRDAVSKVLTSDFLTQGPMVSEFEKHFAEYIGCKYAVAVSNGTAALHLAAMALNVKPGTKVITTPITFAASANCVLYSGGEVFFADIDPETFTIDINKLRKLLESHPKGTFSGIIPVDFAGLPVNTEELKKLADEYGLWILEDACHAPGGYFIDSTGKKIKCGDGQICDAAIFSFHPVKHIASGEGGMITTNRKDLYDKLLLIRTHGITKVPELMHENHGGWYYEMLELGFNYRMTEMQAALGNSQLTRADEGLAKRHEIAERYNKAFENHPNIQLPLGSNKVDFKNNHPSTPLRVTETNPPDHPNKNYDASLCGTDSYRYEDCLLCENKYHAYHLYIIRVPDRKGLYDYLVENNVFVQVHYIPVHLLPYYKNMGWKRGDFPAAENYYDHCLSIPMFPTLTLEEQNFVIEKILEFCK